MSRPYEKDNYFALTKVLTNPTVLTSSKTPPNKTALLPGVATSEKPHLGEGRVPDCFTATHFHFSSASSPSFCFLLFSKEKYDTEYLSFSIKISYKLKSMNDFCRITVTIRLQYEHISVHFSLVNIFLYSLLAVSTINYKFCLVLRCSNLTSGSWTRRHARRVEFTPS